MAQFSWYAAVSVITGLRHSRGIRDIFARNLVSESTMHVNTVGCAWPNTQRSIRPMPVAMPIPRVVCRNLKTATRGLCPALPSVGDRSNELSINRHCQRSRRVINDARRRPIAFLSFTETILCHVRCCFSRDNRVYLGSTLMLMTDAWFGFTRFNVANKEAGGEWKLTWRWDEEAEVQFLTFEWSFEF